MLTYVRDRLLWTVFVIIGITLLTFVITRLVPADPARAAAGLQAREEQVEEMRRRMGLDRPLHEQYIRYITGLVRGDWGTSARSQRPVLEELGIYLPATVELVLASMFIALLVGLPMGILAALWRGSVLDRVLQIVAVGGGALPRFWLALVMQVVFFLFLGWFPAGGRFSFMDARPERISGLYLIDTLLTGNWSGLRTAAHCLSLPALTLSVGQLANLVRITRKSFVNELRQEYVRTGRAKGLPERAVIYRHVFKNAAIPIITIAGLQTGWLFSGAVLVEVVFSWPGIGKYAVDAISFMDFEPIMGVTLVIALIFLLINFLVDISYALVDPRIRY